MKHFFCLLFFFLVFSISSFAQGLPGFGYDMNLFEGKVLKHNSKFTLPIPEHSTGLAMNFIWKTTGKKDWEQRRRYPTIGIGITYTNYGIDSIYGRCFSIYPNMVIPLICGKRLEWTLTIGDGAGYVTGVYSRLKPVDTINIAIGSHLNDYASFMTDLRVHINNHWDVQAGFNFSHISDASYHQPNLGVNLYGSHIGLRYFPATSKPQRITKKLKPLKNRYLLESRFTLAYNQSNAPGGPLYPIYLGTMYVSKRWISKNKFFGGIDYSYHQNIYEFLKNNANSGFIQPGTEFQHSYKAAVLAGNEFLLGRIGVVLQMGYYIHQALQVQGLYYEKIGGNWYIIQKEHGPIKELFMCAFLKTHLSVAELAEFGFGIGF